MIHEIATIDISSGKETEFESAVREAAPLFQAAKGCKTLKLERSIEHPSRYRLVVQWETVEDHTVHFRESPGFQKWRELAGPCFSKPPEVEHVETVLEAF